MLSRIKLGDCHIPRALRRVLAVQDKVLILSASYTEIDQLEQGRARNPNMEALYIVLPTTDNVERICQDFLCVIRIIFRADVRLTSVQRPADTQAKQARQESSAAADTSASTIWCRAYLLYWRYVTAAVYESTC